jgi:amidase
VADVAKLLDVIVGYDAEDPITSLGVGNAPPSFSDLLDRDALRGARIGVINQSMGFHSDPASEDFRMVANVFDSATTDLGEAGAEMINLPEIPGIIETLEKRALDNSEEEAWNQYFLRTDPPPYPSRDAMMQSPDYSKVYRSRNSGVFQRGPEAYGEYLRAREGLMFTISQMMAESQLDAIVHKTVEHQPTLISEGTGPPYYNMRGVTHINTFLVNVPSISVPAGFTTDNLPVGITLLGRPFSDGILIKLAYAYERATGHRRPSAITPPLPGEPS